MLWLVTASAPTLEGAAGAHVRLTFTGEELVWAFNPIARGKIRTWTSPVSEAGGQKGKENSAL